MAKEDESTAIKATTQNIHECETKSEREKECDIYDRLTEEIASLKDIIKTKDHIIDDLIVDLGKTEIERDELKDKYDDALT